MFPGPWGACEFCRSHLEAPVGCKLKLAIVFLESKHGDFLSPCSGNLAALPWGLGEPCAVIKEGTVECLPLRVLLLDARRGLSNDRTTRQRRCRVTPKWPSLTPADLR